MKMPCKSSGLIVASALLLLLMSACSRKDASTEDHRRLIVVSIEPQRYMLEKIVGDRFRIATLMPNSGNPEIFEPSVSSRMAVDRSRLFFVTGFFPFENAATLTLTGDTEAVNTSEGIKLIYGTHSHESEHSTFLHVDSADLTPDPHVWTSVRNARIMSRIMAEAVAKADPAHAEEYMTRYAAFDRHLDSLDKAFARRLEGVSPRTFMVWHPSLSYFARDYGLEQLAVSSESKETSMGQMRGIIDGARADSVKVFFYQTEYDSRQAKAINSGVGSRLVPVSPQAYEWEDQLKSVVDALTRP